ncbi:EAL domain-containing protein [Pantoea cypripedii]|uniref:EAL domain-containing protein n=1 Tax=Pantoea cypripedii TaxID=55209 RepID=A0A1X1EGV7_PANCY|nr:EAL domain-containing protein [Pantoea cypripedii]MBP2199603.1 EAL domain-containing protein (putative c-di-GMP-specific phosphodiesterase class I) [Pantoea cypripedii]ORM88119.1 hypothetical protein HA50_29760 [Pantoea cypripedii]
MSISGIQHALQPVAGIRLQPLVCLTSQEVVAHEVLSTFSPRLDIERYFQAISIEAASRLFFWQVDQIVQQHAEGIFSFNLPLRVLMSPHFLPRLQNYASHQRLMIELQDASALADLNAHQLSRFLQHSEHLRRSGWPLWLDDISEEALLRLTGTGYHFAAIKIAASLFQQSCSSRLHAMTRLARHITGCVIFEGIETHAHLAKAIASGAAVGQGFLWRE